MKAAPRRSVASWCGPSAPWLGPGPVSFGAALWKSRHHACHSIWTTRCDHAFFMLECLTRFTTREDVWQAIASRIGQAYNELEKVGFEYNGQRWHMVCVGLTGDSPFIVKAGCLLRILAVFQKRLEKRFPKGSVSVALLASVVTRWRTSALNPFGSKQSSLTRSRGAWSRRSCWLWVMFARSSCSLLLVSFLHQGCLVVELSV